MIESLEQRCLMSVSLDHGVLRIIGTAGEDQYQLSSDGTDLVVNENGVSSRFDLVSVSSIRARLRAGDDRFDMRGLSIPARILGGRGQDTVYGGQGNDVIYGGDGHDLLYGRAGNDQIYGLQGNDTLYGQHGRDIVLGGGGANMLHGGRGRDAVGDALGSDTIYGGMGPDQIVYDPGFDSLPNPDLQDSLRVELHHAYHDLPVMPPRVVDSANQFAWDLYDQLRQQQGNLFFSPMGVSAALAMTAIGARGQTADEMLDVLHLPGDSPEAFGQLLRQLQSDAPGQPQVHIADALWAQHGLQLEDAFVDSVRANYGATIGNLDLVGDAAAGAADTINQWASANTNGRIPTIVGPEDVKDCALVLANAVYFLGHWAHPFDAGFTYDGNFTTGSGTHMTTPLMHETEYLPYYDGGNFKALELPYEGNGMSMMILLPDQADGLGDLEQQLSAVNLAIWKSQMTTRKVAVTLPKFNISTPTFHLEQELQQLGMDQAFTDHADFSGITTQRSLCVESVLQKAYVTVAENGTEAAAVTTVQVGITSVMPVSPPVAFTADHPFVFVIQDNKTGSTLFAGRVEKPVAPTADQAVPA